MKIEIWTMGYECGDGERYRRQDEFEASSMRLEQHGDTLRIYMEAE